jgi:hypothetical protein
MRHKTVTNVTRSAVLAVFLLLTGSVSLPAQETGVFFTLVNTYTYTAGPRVGDRYLVRTRHTLAVNGFTTDSEGVVWYKAIDNDRPTRIKGTGWVAQDPHELAERGSQPVLVFNDPITRVNSVPPSIEVPATDLQLANVNQPSSLYPEIVWQKVNYETSQPGVLYVRGTTGIFRPFMPEKFITDVHAEMVTQGVDSDRQRRLLSGVVRVGDAQQEVRWALGEPLQQEESIAEELQIQIWHYPGLQVRFENNVVKKIN